MGQGQETKYFILHNELTVLPITHVPNYQKINQSNKSFRFLYGASPAVRRLPGSPSPRSFAQSKNLSLRVSEIRGLEEQELPENTVNLTTLKFRETPLFWLPGCISLFCLGTLYFLDFFLSSLCETVEQTSDPIFPKCGW